MGGSKRETAEKCPTSVPKCLLGLPGSLPEKCPKSVWEVSCAGVAQEKCPERKLRKRRKVKKTKKCQNEKLPKNVQKVSQNALWGFLAGSQKNVQKVSGKCPVLGLREKNVRNEN